jgi:molecular chaperone GrpE
MTDESKEKQDPTAADAASEYVEISRVELEKLQAQVTELEGLREKLMRSAADFENAKKRLTREREEFIKFSQESLLGDLLPILDNFDRALGHQANLETLDTEALKKQLKSLMTGMQMVKKQFLDILQAQGVKPVPAAGELFDPHRHEVIEYVPGEGRADEIITEIQTGSLLHDRLLRASKVRVRSASPEAKKDGSSA